LGHTAEISTDIYFLNRLVSFRNSGLSYHFWLRKKLLKYFTDQRRIKEFKKADAFVVCDCTPNGFWKRLYNIEQLKRITKKPVLFYEVYYLGNAPSIVNILKANKDALADRYDAHLFVSPVTEIRSQVPENA